MTSVGWIAKTGLALALLLGPTPSAHPGTSTCSRDVVGYYPSWSWYLPFLPAEIDWQRVTLVNHAFLEVLADGTVHEDAAFVATRPLLLAGGLASGTPVMVSIGGWGGCTGRRLQAIAADPVLRTALARNLSDYCAAHGYAGISLDWEFPGMVYDAEPGCATLGKDAVQCGTDRVNFALLSNEIRAELDAVDPSLRMAVAVPLNAWFGECFDTATLAGTYDRLEIMAYDMHGNWSGHVGHNAQLHEPTWDPHGGALSSAGAVDYWNLSRGIDAGRLLLGLPFYGYEYPGACAPGDENTGGMAWQPYSEIASSFLDQGWTRGFDVEAQVPYLLANAACGVVSYDDGPSLGAKVEFGLQRGLGGFMIWDLSQDYREPSGRPALLAAATATICPLFEVCDNGSDDDGDTLPDCLDPDCADDPGCCLLDPEADCDGDGVSNDSDCAPLDGGSMQPPGPVTGLELTRSGPDTRIDWEDLSGVAGGGTVYDLILGELESLGGATPVVACLLDNHEATSAFDTAPSPTAGIFYLLRGQNHCGAGSYGSATIDAMPLCD